MQLVRAEFAKFHSENELFAIESALAYVSSSYNSSFLQAAYDGFLRQGKIQLAKLQDMVSLSYRGK